MPDSVLLKIFSFILSKDGGIEKSLTTQLALEKTCRRFHAFLGQDSTMKILYSNPQLCCFLSSEEVSVFHAEFSFQVSLRERLFIVNAMRMARIVQCKVGEFKELEEKRKGTDHLICEYMDGANGLRRIVDKILALMEQPVPDEADGEDAILGFEQNIGGVVIPQDFPPNGFKLFLRGDSIAYLAEVVEQHMVQRLEAAMQLAIFRSKPADSHPYPTVCPEDLVFVDAIRGSFDFDLPFCVVGRHQEKERHRCNMLSLDDSPKKWVWPENNCMDDEIIGAEIMQRLVRAIASRAGVVKLSGPSFECIAAEILHYLAVIVINAFETSKSLWCHGADIGRTRTRFTAPTHQVIVDDIICDLSKCTLASSEDSIHSENSMDSGKSFEFNYISNYPPLSWTVNEEGELVCVIIPRQIKDAAVRLGMKPLLDDHRWEVSEGRTKKEEVKEALLMYGLSLRDESSMLAEDSDSSLTVDSDETGEYESSESGSESGQEGSGSESESD